LVRSEGDKGKMKDGWMGFQEAQRTSHWPHDNQADGMMARVH
jgi:hypothetical protein